MNDFQSTTTGAGLLKDFYSEGDPSRNPLADALKQRRKRLKETLIGDQVDSETVLMDELEEDEGGL